MNRLEFKIEALEKIDKAFDNLQKIENKKNEIKSDLLQKYNETFHSVNKRKQELKESYKAIENSTEDNWKEIKERYSESLKHFNAGFNELEKIFK